MEKVCWGGLSTYLDPIPLQELSSTTTLYGIFDLELPSWHKEGSELAAVVAATKAEAVLLSTMSSEKLSVSEAKDRITTLFAKLKLQSETFGVSIEGKILPAISKEATRMLLHKKS